MSSHSSALLRTCCSDLRTSPRDLSIQCAAIRSPTPVIIAYMLAADVAVAAAVFGLEHLISYCNHTKRCFGPTSRGQGRRLCHAMPNHRHGEVNPKQQLPFCCRSPCESRDCCDAVAVPSGSELPSSLILIQYIIRARTKAQQ